jgi:hypothetical protein
MGIRAVERQTTHTGRLPAPATEWDAVPAFAWRLDLPAITVLSPTGRAHRRY